MASNELLISPRIYLRTKQIIRIIKILVLLVIKGSGNEWSFVI